MTNLSEMTPKEAHRLVAEQLGERGHKAFFEFKGRQLCIEKARAKPLPGAAAGAFLHGEINAANKTVRRVVPIHFTILQALKSPLLTMIENATARKKADVDYSDEQQWEICHVFTCEPKQLRKTFRDSGIEEIKNLW